MRVNSGMSTEPQILNYAAPVKKPSRARILFVIFPYGAGLAIGGFLSLLMLWVAPDFVPFGRLSDVAMGAALIVACGIALVELPAIALISPKLLAMRPWLVVTLLGIVVPVVPTMVLETGMLISLASPPHWFGVAIGVVFLGVCGIGALAAPLVAIDWRPPSAGARPRKTKRFLWRVGTAAVAVVLYVAIVRWSGDALFDRECGKLADWIRSSHPSPGRSFTLTLPGARSNMAEDHRVHGATTTDGKVVFILKTSLGFHHNWDGYLYSSGPIAPNEIGPDGWGRTQVRIPGLPYHYIAKQRDSRHFVVGSDVD